MFDRIRKHSKEALQSLKYDATGLDRDRQILRLACLCHDIGHSPFSHAGEEVMPYIDGSKRRYKHEHYSAALVRQCLREVIEGHPFNENYGIRANDVADFIDGSPAMGRRYIWRTILTGQIDADRCDYLLRDSHHIGVAYGKFDLHRLVNTLRLIPNATGTLVVGVEEGGIHVAEALIIARYMMFTQVYFHKTRRAYDYHFCEALKTLLLEESQKAGMCIADSTFTPPNSAAGLEEYLKWDDWRVLGRIQEGGGGEHGAILRDRNHHRLVFQTSESPRPGEVEVLEKAYGLLKNFSPMIDRPSNSWYKLDGADIPIINWNGTKETFAPLSSLSNVVGGLKSVNQMRIYVPEKYSKEAKQICHEVLK